MAMNKRNAGVAALVIALAAPVVMHFEGKVNKTYLDPIKIPTACYGHTGKELKLGQKYSDEQCKQLLIGDMKTAYDAVNKCITYPVKNNQLAAYTSTAFNIGGGAFCKSGIARKANAGDWKGSCAEISKWVYAGGKVLPGLVKRRKEERLLCEKNDV